MENGNRIEQKLDNLISVVSDMRADMAKYAEKSEGLEKRFDDYLAHGRLESCPLRLEHPVIVDKLSRCADLLEAHDKCLDTLHEDINDIKSRFKFMRWLTLGLIAMVSTGAAAVAILAATHVI